MGTNDRITGLTDDDDDDDDDVDVEEVADGDIVRAPDKFNRSIYRYVVYTVFGLVVKRCDVELSWVAQLSSRARPKLINL